VWLTIFDNKWSSKLKEPSLTGRERQPFDRFIGRAIVD